MPQIQFYEQRSSAVEPLAPVRNFSPQGTGPSSGEMWGNFAEKAGDALYNFAEQKEAYAAHVKGINDKIKLHSDFEDIKNQWAQEQDPNVAPDTHALVDRINKHAEEFSNKNASEFGFSKSQYLYQNQIAETQYELVNKAMTFGSQQQSAWAANSLELSGNKLKVAIQQGLISKEEAQNSYGQLNSSMGVYVNNPELLAKDKREFDQASSDVYLDTVATKVAIGPNTTYQGIKRTLDEMMKENSPLSSGVSAKQFDQSRSMLLHALKTKQEENSLISAQSAKEGLEQVIGTQADLKNNYTRYSPSWIKQNIKPNQQEEYLNLSRRAGMSLEIGNLIRNSDMTFSDIEKATQSLQDKTNLAGVDHYTSAEKNAELAKQVWSDIKTGLSTDKAQTLMRYNPSLQKKWDLFASLSQSGDTQGAKEAFDSYKTAMTVEADRRGVTPTMIPKSYAEGFAKQFEVIDSTPKGAQDFTNKIKSSVAMWGDAAPTILRDMQHFKVAKDNSALFVAVSLADHPDSTKLINKVAEVANNKLEENKTYKDETKRKDLALAFENKFQDYANSIQFDANRTEVRSSVEEMAFKIGLDAGAFSGKPEEAVGRFVDAALNSQFEFRSMGGNGSVKVRVPKMYNGHSVDADIVQSAGENVLDGVSDGSIKTRLLYDTQGRPAVKQAQLNAAHMKPNIFLANNGNDGVLVKIRNNDTTVQSVYTPEGKPVAFTWDELYQIKEKQKTKVIPQVY